MPNRAGRIPISRPGPATPNLDTVTTLGFGVPMADRRTRLEDAPSDSIRRTSQEGLSPKGRKVNVAARKATMPEPYLLKSKICLVGERGVGKSSLIRRYVLDQFDDKYVRTLGAKVEKKTMRLDVPERHAQVDIYMAIWDIIGHVGFRQLLGDSFFNGAQGILAVADLTRRETLVGPRRFAAVMAHFPEAAAQDDTHSGSFHAVRMPRMPSFMADLSNHSLSRFGPERKPA